MDTSPHAKVSSTESQVTQVMHDLDATRWDCTPVDHHVFVPVEILGESVLECAPASALALRRAGAVYSDAPFLARWGWERVDE
jgi:hypothetical protein